MQIQKSNYKGVLSIALILFGCFFTLGIIASDNKPTYNPEKVVYKEVCSDSEKIKTYEALKDVDDKGFYLASEAMGISSKMMYALEEQDVKSFTQHTRDLEELNIKINDIAQERLALLKKLGY